VYDAGMRRLHLNRAICSLAAALLLGAPAIVSPAGAQNAVADVLLDPGHPEWYTPAPDRFRARFVTGDGEFVLEVHRRWARRGADRLYNLIRLGYFDDTRVHRVREDYIAQFGLSGEPAVNEAWYEKTLPDDPPRRSNLRGTVAYAMLEAPGTRTTQLYINLADNTHLDAQGFAPVARVVEGMAVVDRFYAGYDERAGGGMRAGNQGRIVSEGNAHLDAEFPRLTRIERAEIEPASVLRFPSPGENRTRIEAHLLPAVSTGPMDPAWSPDGSRIAFSMRGDIWVVPEAGGEAVALTRGPAYYFEPDWSPDGTRIAFSHELDGNLDIGVVDVESGVVTVIAGHPHIDIAPAWHPDGSGLFFASARAGDFDIFFVPVDAAGAADAAATPVPVVNTRRHEIQPSPSPRGDRLAFVAPVRGRLGTGGLWTVPLGASPTAADDDPTEPYLVHYEETSYRAEPTWTPDGRALVFVSDAAGSNDLATVPAGGGSLARMTEHAAHEYDPAISPDGSRVAFVSNRSGATRMYTAPAAGSRRQGWSAVTIGETRPTAPHGIVQLELRDAGSGEPVTARVHVVASDERAYAPDGGFHRVASATENHYFHAAGDVQLSLPAGPAWIEAMRGPEFLPVSGEIDVVAGETVTLSLAIDRLVDAPASGWISGDTHAHDLHQGRFGLSHETYFAQSLGEDLHVTNALIHMDGTRLMGRWEDLTGEPHPLSTPTHILQYGQEFRGSMGHVGLLGLSEFVMPLIGGTRATAFADDVLNYPYMEEAREQGGIGGYMHPYASEVQGPGDAAGSEIALDVALGQGDFYDVANVPYDDRVNAGMYHRFLNAGFRLPATGGSDSFADVWRDAPAGTARTYARVHGRFDVGAWLAAIKDGATFATNGPLVWMHVSPVVADAEGEIVAMGALGVGTGGALGVGPAATTTFEVDVEVASIAPLQQVEILVNGQVAHTVDVRGSGRQFRLQRRVEIPASAWVAVMVTGPAARYVADGYPFAHTSPVWIDRDGQPYRDPDAARFLADVVRLLWDRVSTRDRFSTDAGRDRYRAAVEQAIEVYERIAREASR
jgi:Tol biopolymer transport system component/cyclophilin family peptidyl-prolyl cis-trans isomerase